MSDFPWLEDDEMYPDAPVVIERDGIRFVVPESSLPSWLTSEATAE